MPIEPAPVARATPSPGGDPSPAGEGARDLAGEEAPAGVRACGPPGEDAPADRPAPGLSAEDAPADEGACGLPGEDALDWITARGLLAARRASLCAVVASLPVAAILIDRDGRSVEVNDAARALVCDAEGVLFLGLTGELRCRVPPGDAAIAAAVARALCRRATVVLKVADYGGAGDAVVAAVPVAADDAAVVLLLTETVAPESLAATLGELFKLAPAQVDMALACHRGERTAELAARTGTDEFAASVTRIETLERLGVPDGIAAARRIAALERLVPPTRAPVPVLGRTA